MDLEIILIREESQTKKDKYHMILLICRIQKNYTNELTYKIKTDRLGEGTYSYQSGRAERGINCEFGIDMYTLLYL